MSEQEKHYEYEFGYAKPPKQSRFKKGNPGFSRLMRRKREVERTKHLTPLQILATVLDERIPVSAGGKRRQMTTMEALIRSTVSAAASGDRAARKEIMALVVKLPQPPGEEIWTTRVTPETHPLWDRFLENSKKPEEAAADDQTKPVLPVPQEADVQPKKDGTRRHPVRKVQPRLP